MNWTAVGIIGTLVVSFLGALFGLYQARKADRSATTTRTIELGVQDLVNQYRERNEELLDEVHECTGKCRELEAKVSALEAAGRNLQVVIDDLRTSIDNKDAEIIRLRTKAGEL